MKKLYESPEMEVVKCTIVDNALSESYEHGIPSETAGSEIPTGESSLPDF